MALRARMVPRSVNRLRLRPHKTFDFAGRQGHRILDRFFLLGTPSAPVRTFVNFERDEPGAETVSRVGHRLTRTSVIAAAVLDIFAFNLQF